MLYSDIILLDTPVSFWKLDEPSGTTAFDTLSTNSGVYSNCTLNQTACPGSQIGPSVLFNGTSSNITIPTSPSLHPTTNISIEAWIYPRVVNNGLNLFIMAGNGPANPDYVLKIDSLSNKIRFNIVVSGSTYTAEQISRLPPNFWYHVVGTYDGSAVKLYVNGVLEATTIISGTITNSNQVISIGRRNVGPDSYFNGNITNISYYSYPLTLAQVLSHYDASGYHPNARSSQFLKEALILPATTIPKTTVFFKEAIIQPDPIPYTSVFFKEVIYPNPTPPTSPPNPGAATTQIVVETLVNG